ncbi:MAG: FAD-binding protein, partial [Candidatus Heimdallarchaeota archaeon]
MYKWFGMMKSNYDLVVIGAGTAGTLAAFAAKEEGLENVLLIDRKSRENIG